VHGHVRVDAPIEWENDQKKAKGKNGARTTTQGRKQSSVTIELEIEDALTLAGESQYDLTQAALDSLIAKGPGPYGVANGATDAGRVRDIMIDSIKGPKFSGGKISWSIQAKRWDSPAVGVGSGTGGGLGPPPVALLQEIKWLEAQLAAAKSGNIQDQTKIQALEGQLAAAKKKLSAYKTATNTPTASEPTKASGKPQDYYQVQKPTGEIQPTGTGAA
jgi:hypothetical protein